MNFFGPEPALPLFSGWAYESIKTLTISEHKKYWHTLESYQQAKLYLKTPFAPDVNLTLALCTTFYAYALPYRRGACNSLVILGFPCLSIRNYAQKLSSALWYPISTNPKW
jgi:hypothetical protein